MTSWKQYLRNQIIANFVINLLINGLIAYYSFRLREHVPFSEMAVDGLITVFIIGFLVSWFALFVLKGEITKGNIQMQGMKPVWGSKFRLPSNAVLRALIITLVVVLVFGGLLLTGSFSIFTPNGVSSMAYFIIKGFYAGICAAVTAALTIYTVYNDQIRSAAST